MLTALSPMPAVTERREWVPTTCPVLRMHGVRKAFPGVQALDGAELTLYPGECHALMGENGAGKSTLIKVLGGVHTADEGEVLLDGEAVRFASTGESEAAGVAVIYQEFNLVPMMTARENLFLGKERSRLGFGSVRGERARARELFAMMKSEIDSEARVDSLSVAQQQVVEIAKALAMDARVLVMDEPTAALTDREVDRLFEIIRDLRSRGIAVVYVSHRMDEIFAICDRITVMRDGKFVGSSPTSGTTRERVVELMVGRELADEFPARDRRIGGPALRVDGLGREGAVEPATFELQTGEILGLTGLVGAGRTELARLLFGADRATSGRIEIGGVSRPIRSPRDAIAAGICLLTEDRKHQGLILGHSLRENFGLPNLGDFERGGFVDKARERSAFGGFIEALRIKTPGQEQLAKNLSGGNQQKVVLAKWLQRRSRVLIFDEPTRGIDVGAKFEIYQLMNDLVSNGASIIMISSELPEVLGMADRILVMREGAIVGEIADARSATQEQVMKLAVGSAGSP